MAENASSRSRASSWTLIKSSRGPKVAGFVTFDGLFSIIPVMMILLFSMQVANYLTSQSLERMHQQEVFSKIVSIADYIVKQGAAKTVVIGNSSMEIGGIQAKTEVRRPNLIDESKLTSSLEHNLKAKAGLDRLSISLNSPGEGQVCIYRIVVIDGSDDVSLLYVCGD